MNHTPGPLHQAACAPWHIATQHVPVAICLGLNGADEIAQANARRLAACWNYCQHLNTLDMERATAASADAAPFDAMRDSLRAGVTVVSAPQLFLTPPDLAARMVAIADVQPGHRVLEPSAGTGRILDAVAAAGVPCEVRAVEVSRDLAAGLLRHPLAKVRSCATDYSVKGGDFLTVDPARWGTFDRILMNPPFALGADVDHVTHAVRFLAPGGRLVAIMSAGVSFRDDRRTREFRALVDQMDGLIEALPAGTFAASGTGANTVLVVLDAPGVAVAPAARRAEVAA